MGNETDVGFQELSAEDIRGGDESILVVDDEHGLRHLIGDILSSKGYKIFIAEDSKEVIRILGQQNIGLIISDVTSVTDDYMLVNRVRERFPKVKIQMLGNPGDCQHLKFLDKNLCSHVLHRPYRIVELLTRVRLLLDDAGPED